MQSLPIYNIEGKEVEQVSLDEEIFDGEVNEDVLYQTVLMYRARARKGTASTKTRGEVSGGGRKPWRQKGTGRARVGSIRSPLWRGGGIVFGPHPRKYSYSLPNKIKILALKSSLNAKLKERSILILDNLSIEQPKTKVFAKILKNLRFFLLLNKKQPKTLLLLEKCDENIRRSTNNFNFLEINSAQDTNAMNILRAKLLVMTKAALAELIQRIKNNLKQNNKLNKAQGSD